MKIYWLVPIITVIVLALMWRGPERPAFTAFAAIPIRENGRIEPLDTLARNSLNAISGQQTIKLENTVSAVQWLACVFFDESEADRYPVFWIHDPGVLGLCGFGNVQRNYFSYRELEPCLASIEAEAEKSQWTASRTGSYQTSILKLRDHIALYQRLKNGIQAVDGKEFHPASINRELKEAFRSGNWGLFAEHASHIANARPELVWRMQLETGLNRIALFSRCIAIYAAVLFWVCAAWVLHSEGLRRGVFLLFLLGLTLHGGGICMRMILQGCPPVTNLYSSALFVGWVAALIGLWLERRLRDGFSLAGASLAGLVTLTIAHYLAGAGDTLEMLQAVLNTRLWLVAHVLTISLGYSAILLAGGLAVFFVFREALAHPLHRVSARRLEDITLAMIRFAVFFAVAGTLLGGIWADQCWGRFWGWDPKENGALLVVLWYGAILHARRSGRLGRHGLMAMALLGNAVTAFSWFGVNMLGVGLHSYGSLGEKAWPWLVAWIFGQCALALLAMLPLRRWRVLCNWYFRSHVRRTASE